MNAMPDESATELHDLILFVAGDAPRSRRARSNLEVALQAAGLDGHWPREIDVLSAPGEAIRFGMFATPALLRTDSFGQESVLYGDLSDDAALRRYLDGLVATTD